MRHPCRAYSLTELLVVMFIIAILVSLLGTALIRALTHTHGMFG